MFEFISLILALLAILTIGIMFVTGSFLDGWGVITAFGLVALVLSGAAGYFAFNADSFAAEAFRIFSVTVGMLSFILAGAGFSGGVSHFNGTQERAYKASARKK